MPAMISLAFELVIANFIQFPTARSPEPPNKRGELCGSKRLYSSAIAWLVCPKLQKRMVLTWYIREEKRKKKAMINHNQPWHFRAQYATHGKPT
jgi:hypothetical protein